MELSDQLNVHAALPTVVSTGSWMVRTVLLPRGPIVGWVGPRASMDVLEQTVLRGIETRIIQPVAWSMHSQSCLLFALYGC